MPTRWHPISAASLGLNKGRIPRGAGVAPGSRVTAALFLRRVILPSSAWSRFTYPAVARRRGTAIRNRNSSAFVEGSPAPPG